jgi:hypothetical protein
MWYLKRLSSSKTARDDLFYLRQGKHVVGRQTARCQLAFVDDPTLSREHATILVRYNNAVNPTENGLFLKDGVSTAKPKSSTGTFRNGERISVNFSSSSNWLPLQVGDNIHFGSAKTAFEVCQTKTKMRFATTKVSKRDLRETVVKCIDALGGVFSKEWSNEHTDCLVTTSFSSTFKVISAIAAQKKIVSCGWLQRAALTNEYRSPMDMLNACGEDDMPSGIIAAINQPSSQRRQLFAGGTYICVSAPPKDLDYLALVELCGGEILRCYDDIDAFPSPLTSRSVKNMYLLSSPGSTNGEIVAKRREAMAMTKELHRVGVTTVSHETIAKRIVVDAKISIGMPVGNSQTLSQQSMSQGFGKGTTQEHSGSARSEEGSDRGKILTSPKQHVTPLGRSTSMSRRPQSMEKGLPALIAFPTEDDGESVCLVNQNTRLLSPPPLSIEKVVPTHTPTGEKIEKIESVYEQGKNQFQRIHDKKQLLAKKKLEARLRQRSEGQQQLKKKPLAPKPILSPRDDEVENTSIDTTGIVTSEPSSNSAALTIVAVDAPHVNQNGVVWVRRNKRSRDEDTENHQDTVRYEDLIVSETSEDLETPATASISTCSSAPGPFAGSKTFKKQRVSVARKIVQYEDMYVEVLAESERSKQMRAEFEAIDRRADLAALM